MLDRRQGGDADEKRQPWEGSSSEPETADCRARVGDGRVSEPWCSFRVALCCAVGIQREREEEMGVMGKYERRVQRPRSSLQAGG